MPKPDETDDFAARVDAAMQQQGAPTAQTAQDSQTAEQTETEPVPSAQPVGQGDYVVRSGDCMSSIAREHGFFWETLWNDSGNTELRNTRQDPNILLPGDHVTIPELRPKDEACATEQHHRFRRKGEPAKLRLRVMQEREEEAAEVREVDEEGDEVGGGGDEPRANVPYTLTIDGELHSGETDADGYLEVPIPGNARRGLLLVEPGTPRELRIELALGGLDPLDTNRGVKQRLANLGFECEDSDEITERDEVALREFQEQHELAATGQPDQATRDKLKEVHGS